MGKREVAIQNQSAAIEQQLRQYRAAGPAFHQLVVRYQQLGASIADAERDIKQLTS